MQKVSTLLTFLFILSFHYARGQCNNVFLTSQFAVNNFSCTTITGNLIIAGSNVMDLSPLNTLESVGGNITVVQAGITDFTGLENLETIGGFFTVALNHSLIDFNGLSSLEGVGGSFAVGVNNSLVNFEGLDVLKTINKEFAINANPSLENFKGLETLASSGGLNIRANDVLTTLDGLSDYLHDDGFLRILGNPLLMDLSDLNNLQTITQRLEIADNASLPDLVGLENTTIGTDLIIHGNLVLNFCSTSSICSYLNAPNGSVLINNNSVLCANVPIVQSFCTFLPVDLVDFSGVAENRTSKLKWFTASEENNDYFVIEHSVDGTLFEDIGRVDGNGTTMQLSSYNFTHSAPNSGINYYRLKQVDLNGIYEYSEIITITHEAPKGRKIFPNPTRDYVFFSGYENSKINIEIFDATGRSVLNKQGHQQFNPLDISTLEGGIYFVKIWDNNQSFTPIKLFKE